MASQHGAIPRGLDATRSSLPQGRFGRMFRNLKPAQFGANEVQTIDNLSKLAAAMIGNDPPSDGPDPEESGIPSLYTYFGQFIDHDITFDPVSVLTKFRDPDGLVDFRTPALDLDNIYGRGPSDQPYLYQPDGRSLRLGEALAGREDGPHDLPRLGDRAVIGDPRNDENTIVSQLQGLFLKFHNRLAADNPDLGFPELQQRVQFHYQYVVVNDFLARLISPGVLKELRDPQTGLYSKDRLRFFHWKNDPFMPVEFSVAAYRLGHSMVRPGYRLNDNPESLLPIFPIDDGPGLTGFLPVGPERVIDWARFIDNEVREYDGTGEAKKQRLQFAYRLDAAMVGPLGNLPHSVSGGPPASLALRNLERGWRLGLPSGQAVARAMGEKPLLDKEILIGRALDPEDVGAGEEARPIVEVGGTVFAGNCPLWVYVLAEAARNRQAVETPTASKRKINTPQLGPVGGRIVAEVILGLLFGDNLSVLTLDPEWTPVTGPDFKLKDIVNYALGVGGPLR